MEMDDAKEAFLEETWTEIDEDMKGYATKDDMKNFLQAAWELKNWDKTGKSIIQELKEILCNSQQI